MIRDTRTGFYAGCATTREVEAHISGSSGELVVIPANAAGESR